LVSSKTLGRSLFVAGFVLCLFYAGTMVYRSLGSRLAVRAFEVAHAPNGAPVRDSGAGGFRGAMVDFRLWSTKRIAAYQDALAKQLTPPLAVIRIQRLGMEVPVFDGTDELVLNRGAGRIAGTAPVGRPGNVGIAGHRDGFFRPLKDVAIGDSLTLETSDGIADYVVDDLKIVEPADVSVLSPTAVPTITLVTCYPFYFAGDAPQRFIVRCSRKDRLKTDTPAGSPVTLANAEERR
jgi:sortase A